MPPRRSKQRGGRGSDVALAHQALADEVCLYPDPAEPAEIGRGEDAALADEDTLTRNEGRQAFADGKARLEAAQVAIVDADEARFELQGAPELGLIVHLEESVHAEI